MKSIILAAGQGSRMMPLTEKVPKCMVEFFGKPLLDYTIENFSGFDIVLVTGYQHQEIRHECVEKIHNEKYMQTTMADSLFVALKEDEDVVVSYSDIIYKKSVLEALMRDENEFSVVVDRSWLNLWSLRTTDPLSDAETLVVEDGQIVEIGKKPDDFSKIQGQYIGLIKLKKSVVPKVRKTYIETNPKHMTDLIQSCIESGVKVSPVWISGCWMEFDTPSDLCLTEYWKLFD